MELQGKTAVITGGAIRVGRAITLALAQAECNVYIHYNRSTTPALETQQAAQAFGVRAEVYSADLHDATAVQAIMPAARAAFGQIDILINNAAIFPEEDSFTATDLALWDELFHINLRAPFLLCQAFAAQLPPDRPGCIVNVLDARVRRPYPDHFAYRLSKGALWQMTEMLAHELAPHITINGVALGAILPPPGKGQNYLDTLAQERVPLQRPGSPDIVAQNILHLLRQDFLTGVILPIDGGEFL
ncbi:MAG: SDR family oxidoreductase [Chloroflexi bacterium]|nr:SDR family oxidoreductase [Ardenticatenaceae bacterium]MBL1131001.1 SDR family oxidoreductase [Chloroflexota bacterium]NOG37099.1 SDR family oxidoreductase [Chloroflexota bacterium]GIK58769.1 MAG: short chain dehydrogenase [Chloroflexota bacterium]